MYNSVPAPPVNIRISNVLVPYVMPKNKGSLLNTKKKL